MVIESQRLYHAIKLAAMAHAGQTRKGKTPIPYIAHPVFAGMELLRRGYREDVVIARKQKNLLGNISVTSLRMGFSHQISLWTQPEEKFLCLLEPFRLLKRKEFLLSTL